MKYLRLIISLLFCAWLIFNYIDRFESPVRNQGHEVEFSIEQGPTAIINFFEQNLLAQTIIYILLALFLGAFVELKKLPSERARGAELSEREEKSC